MTFKIEWIDAGREPRCPPDPDYPNGKDVVMAQVGDRCCNVSLAHPARRCGVYIVECSVCGIRIGVTTAGRPDDPRSVRIACKETLQ